LIGAKVTRIRTLKKYLDASNFSGGTNATADPYAEFPREIFIIDRKVAENRAVVSFELSATFDVAGVKLPRRQIIQNICPWTYKGEGCGYTGTSYFDINDNPVSSVTSDVCGHRLSSCKLRFGANAELPYGGFPSAGLIG
jgi:lambda family phage minor tail protein L